MNLLDIRKTLVKLSGRYDLVVDTDRYEDNGANFFIQAGQRLLDGFLSNPKENQRFDISLSAGQYYIDLTEVRAVRKVEVVSSDEYQELDRMDLSALRDTYGNFEQMNSVDKGLPKFYSIGVQRRDSDDPIKNTGTRLFVMPPSDKPRTVYVTALYMSNQLTENKDTSWWSEEYPDLLIQAAMYKAEVFLRNQSGARDWLTDIQFAVNLIDNDRVEEAIANIDQMKDSWTYEHELPRRSRSYGTRKF